MNSHRLNRKTRDLLASEWFAGCKSDEQKQELEQYLRNSTRLFDLLKSMVQKRYDASLGTKEADYDSVSWSHKQAHRNGKLEAFEEIWKLLP